jgi:twitching motility protein PilT
MPADSSLARLSSLEAQIDILADRLNQLEERLASGRLPRRRPGRPPEEAGPEVSLAYSLEDLFRVMIKHGATDLHLKAGAPPTVRLHGELVPIGTEILDEAQVRCLVLGGLPAAGRRKLRRERAVDLACSCDSARLRAHVFYQRNGLSAAYRLLRSQMPSFEELGLPPVLADFARFNNGLVLVTGPAGQGKSTTLAALVDFINANRRVHVITIEDPIEYFHTDRSSYITQREVGTDTASFLEGLKQALREDPDVILVGEMRDPETMMTALQAAETGHLVFSTLHTPNAPQAVDRIVDSFPADSQQQVRFLLSRCLRAVVAQRLLTRRDGQGRIPAVEVMVCTPTIRAYIQEGRTGDIATLMEEGGTEGMQTFTQSLVSLYQRGLIDEEEALFHADVAHAFRLAITGHTTGTVTLHGRQDESLINRL